MADTRYCCALCDMLKREDKFAEQRGGMVCSVCLDDYQALQGLYNEIVRTIPSDEREPMPVLFRRLWQMKHGQTLVVAREYERVIDIYQNVVSARPRYRNMAPAELFEKMWEHLKTG